MSAKYEKDLWKALDKLALQGSIVAIGILTVAYYAIANSNAPEDTIWSIASVFAQDIIANLLPTFLVLVGSYALFRRIQTIKSEKQAEELASSVSSKVLKAQASEFGAIIQALDGIQEQVDAVDSSRVRAERFLQLRDSIPHLPQRLAQKKNIDICAISSMAITHEYSSMLLDKIGQGGRVRLLLLNPENDALMQDIYFLLGANTPEVVRREIKSSLDYLSTDPHFVNSGLVEIRLCNHAIGHTVLIGDGDTPQGEMRVEMYLSGIRGRDRPGFLLRKTEDPFWFKVFWRQFNELWTSAIPYSLSYTDDQTHR